jgi:PAS domain S-box-containing protein
MNNGSTFGNSLIVNMLSNNLKEFFDALNLGYCLINVKGEITEVNSMLTQITGFKAEDLIDKSLYDLVQASHREKVKQIIDGLNKSKNYTIECEINTQPGETASAILHSTILNSTNHHAEGAVILVENISKYQKTIDQLTTRNNEYQNEIENTISKFTTLVANSRDVLYSLYYQDYKFEYLSPSIYELTGYTHEEVVAMNKDQLLQIIHADFRDIYRKYWKSLKDKKNRLNHTHEFKIRPKEGISRWLSDNHKLIFDNQGNLVKLVGNIRDITDFKLVEEALNRSRDRLYKAIEATND